MAYTDPEERRKYDREWRRKNRAEKRAAEAQQGPDGGASPLTAQPGKPVGVGYSQKPRQTPSFVIIGLVITLLMSGVSLWLSWDTASRFNAIFYP